MLLIQYKKNSLEILKSIAKYADICELGFPHFAPIADGARNSTSSNRAIKNGFKMKDAFQIVKSFKKNVNQNHNSYGLLQYDFSVW